MKFGSTEIPGLFTIESVRHEDTRGVFQRVQSREDFAARGIPMPEQSSLSHNRRRGTVRGLHFQLAPHNEAKLVVCVSGRMYDAVVDLRRSSPTFGRAVGIELSASGLSMVHVPFGCAHGFQTLEDDTVVLYMISAAYQPDAARGVRWDDPQLGLDWPIREPVFLSERDKQFPGFAELETYF